MKKKSSLLFLISAGLFALFLVFTIAVAVLDKATVTYENGITAKVGFASINQAVHQALGKSSLWYNFTEFLGILAFFVVALFALIGFCQLVTRKSIWGVDREILLLGVLYILVAIFYVLFELIVINYRPILIEGVLEASYPSSHSILACTVFVTAPFACGHFAKKNPGAYTLVSLICFLFAFITIIGRLFSGVHWLTDIIGACLLSASLVLLYIAALALLKEGSQKKHRHHSHR